MTAPLHLQKRRSPFRFLGPGLIAGAADDDPSGIATYSQAGAQFGFGLLWTVVLTWPLMVAVQLISARIGRVTGRGIAANIKDTMQRPENPGQTARQNEDRSLCSLGGWKNFFPLPSSLFSHYDLKYVLTSLILPVIAATAAISGLIKCVRPPGP